MTKRTDWARLLCVLALGGASIPLACGAHKDCSGPNGLCVAPGVATAGAQAATNAGGSANLGAGGSDDTGAAGETGNAESEAGSGGGGAPGMISFPAFGGVPNIGLGGGGPAGSGRGGCDGCSGKGGGTSGGLPPGNWVSCLPSAAFTNTCSASDDAGVGADAATGAAGAPFDCGPDGTVLVDAGSSGGSTAFGNDGGPVGSGNTGAGGATGVPDASTGPGGPADASTSGGPSLSDFLIDDFEDGDSRTLYVLNGRGTWFSAADPTGDFFPAPCFAASHPDVSAIYGQLALHVYGSSFQPGGYADMGVFFSTSSPACDRPLDARGMMGIRFFARTSAGAAQGFGLIRVSVQTTATNPVDAHGTCTGNCYDAHGSYAYLGEKWMEYRIPFPLMKQQGWGTPAALDVSQIWALIWTAKADMTGTVATCFDYWIDDVGFYQSSPICGDGVVEASEACDDGNSMPGDGCDGTCRIESGFVCTNAGQLCTHILN